MFETNGSVPHPVLSSEMVRAGKHLIITGGWTTRVSRG
jgi:hypothetical protein